MPSARSSADQAQPFPRSVADVTSRWVQARIRPSHHRQEHAALSQGLDHLAAANAGARGLEENTRWVSGLLHLDAIDLRQPARPAPLHWRDRRRGGPTLMASA